MIAPRYYDQFAPALGFVLGYTLRAVYVRVRDERRIIRMRDDSPVPAEIRAQGRQAIRAYTRSFAKATAKGMELHARAARQLPPRRSWLRRVLSWR